MCNYYICSLIIRDHSLSLHLLMYLRIVDDFFEPKEQHNHLDNVDCEMNVWIYIDVVL